MVSDWATWKSDKHQETNMKDHLFFIGLGLGGMLLHLLMDIRRLVKNQDGVVDYKKYFRVSWVDFMISIVVIVLADMVKTEIKQLQYADKFLGLGFIAIGYMSDSLVASLMGRVQKYIDKIQE